MGGLATKEIARAFLVPEPTICAAAGAGQAQDQSGRDPVPDAPGPPAPRRARFYDGELVLLGDQDRSLWNSGQTAAGRAELDRALALGGRGPYVVQAAIASLLADVPCDWRQIAARYGQLARLTGSPVVEFGRADDAYRRAWQLADDGAERRFLERLLAGATGPS